MLDGLTCPDSDDERPYENDNLSNNIDEVDYPPNNYEYRRRDIVVVVVGIVTYFLDWGFDILTAHTHWRNKDVIWFTLTVLFLSVPSLVVTFVSLSWYIKDIANENTPKASVNRWVVRSVMLIFQLGPLLRYVDSLMYGVVSRSIGRRGNREMQKEYYSKMLYEEGDAVLLRLFECFMEAAPQLVLQLYILTQQPDSEKYGRTWEILLSLGCVTSLLSLAWGVTAHARSIRFTDHQKNNISCLGTVVLFLWHIFSLGARVSAMVLFASRFRLYLLAVCAAHWFLMVIWFMARRSFSDTCPRLLGEWLLSFLFAAVHIFTFINDKDEPTLKKYIAFYTICGIENIAMVVLWLIYANPSIWYYIPGVVFHFFSFFLGITCMVAYYKFLHPTVLPTHIVRDEGMLRQQVDSPAAV
ncbi:XK-related protein 6-like [Homarus americanus]|uniref:XK-related protein 6-like n=1 Tax=Homarus americanus TaxID=6706 RepID=UPI001C439E5A|nr:XK-related protein 6-like [Homarus americanus]